jgi:hypothetical protein
MSRCLQVFLSYNRQELDNAQVSINTCLWPWQRHVRAVAAACRLPQLQTAALATVKILVQSA